MDRQNTSSLISNTVQFGGIFEPQQCKELAKKIMELYDTNKSGQIGQAEIGFIISDSYRATNKGFNPTQNDIAGGQKILDRKGQGTVRLDDVEALVSKYFAGKAPAVPVAPIKKIPQKLSKTAQDRLEVARRIFTKIDEEKKGYLTKKEVPFLLIETYKQMGNSNYEPSDEDVHIWIEMTDSDGDGQVTLEDYEQLVLRSLQQQGISLE